MPENLEKAREIIYGAVPLALKTVIEVMKAPGRNAASQLSAAQDILDRAGLRTQSGSIVIANNVSASAAIDQNAISRVMPNLQSYSAEQRAALRDYAVECKRLGVSVVLEIPDLEPADYSR